MFESLLRRLLDPAPATLADPDARLALAALLVRVARADDHYTPAETARIDAVLRARFGLSPFEAVRLRTGAETLEEEAPDTVRFTRAIKEHVPYDDRLGVIEALWDVALADGARSADEDGLLRLVAPMLGVEDADSALARQRVEARRA
ncbi:TerB family tellurite resistance protein [Rubellimicrobium aerolatum]|uniref:TerB family tellurite resistance protein n=1 Tax=Rubellimicrobium aerolatum TaxID=490979 RepID=A0ABW0S8X4_9RHOB|nr:TerB family tellurite resistance protein [Rubellimicrobium aerolatum]MBP1804736.1 putative tellurite resistance protein B-like protein [Rubellimicrobium aerolatum]